MKRIVAGVMGAAVMSLSGAASAEWSLNAGAESFRWKESTQPQVKESGLRWALGLSWLQSKDPGLSVGWDLKYYVGNVDYDGATLFGNVPLSSEAHYKGFANEIQAFWRMPNHFDIVFGVGYDFWERRFASSGQEEDWQVIYGKLGAQFGQSAKQGILASAGIKYPVWTRENGNFESLGAVGNPRLRPGRKPSLYGTIGYRFTPQWDVIAYYDSYRFEESNVVAVPFPTVIQGFIQPESKQDVFGLKIQYNIQ